MESQSYLKAQQLTWYQNSFKTVIKTLTLLIIGQYQGGLTEEIKALGFIPSSYKSLYLMWNWT